MVGCEYELVTERLKEMRAQERETVSVFVRAGMIVSWGNAVGILCDKGMQWTSRESVQ